MTYSEQDFDEELRERLGQDAPLPPGMDWQAMRKGIKAKVAGKTESKKIFPIWWWLGLGLILLLVINFLAYRTYYKSTLPASGTVAQNKVRPGHQGSDNYVASPILVPELSEPAFSHETGDTQADLQTVTIPQGRLSTLEKTASISENIAPADSLNNTQWELTAGLTEDSVARGKTYTSSAFGPGNNAATGVPLPDYKDVTVQFLPRYTFVAKGDFSPTLRAEKEVGRKLDLKQTAGVADIPSKPKRWMIDFLAGTQVAASTYRGDNVAEVDLRSATETPLPGHHLALGLVKPINERWQLRTGLAYDRYRARTDLVGTSVFDSIFQDVPIGVGIGGDTIFGAAELRVTESREFRSFLREQRLSLPLLVGRQFQLGKGFLTLRGGPEVGLLIGSGGKVLMRNNRSRSLSDADFQRLRISVRFEGELSVPVGTNGPLLIGRVAFGQVLGGGRIEPRRIGNYLSAGVGLSMPF